MYIFISNNDVYICTYMYIFISNNDVYIYIYNNNNQIGSS